MATATRRDRAMERARALGRKAGHNAATWVEVGDGRAILAGIESCDPAVLDAFNLPNLSGQYADDPTPASLAAEVWACPDRVSPERIQDACTAWEDAAQDAFWREVERTCRYHAGA